MAGRVVGPGHGAGGIRAPVLGGRGRLPQYGNILADPQEGAAVRVDQPAPEIGLPVDPQRLQDMIANLVAQAMANHAAVEGALGGPARAGRPDQALAPEQVLVPELSEVDKVLITCGIEDPETRDIIRIAEAFGTLESFRLLEDDDAVDAWLKRASQKAAPNQLSLGEVAIYNLKGLAYWVRDRIARELPLIADEFDENAMREAIEMRRLDKKRNKDDDIKEPGKCETGTGWDEWKESFVNFCSQKRGVAGGPLSYVIRDNVDRIGHAFRDEQERKLYQYPHQGNAFVEDNRKVAQLLKSSALATDAYVYIEANLESMNGREAWLALVDHYDGAGEREKRTSKAQADLKALHYRGNEIIFPFETFSTKFLKALKILNKSANHAIAPGAQVDLLLQKMSGVSNTAIQAAMELAASKHQDNVNACINELSTTIAKRLRDQVHLRETKGNNRKRKLSELGRRTDGKSGGRGRGRQGRGHSGHPGRGSGRGSGGRTGRGVGGRMEINGVDVSNPNRTFSPDEMTQLGKVGRDYIFEKRKSKEQGSHTQKARQMSEANTKSPPRPADNPNDSSNDQSNFRNEKGAKNGAKFGNRS